MSVTEDPLDPLRNARERVAAVELLVENRKAYEGVITTRLHLIHAARRTGLSNREIGQVLGVTEGAVRYMTTKRSADAA